MNFKYRKQIDNIQKLPTYQLIHSVINIGLLSFISISLKIFIILYTLKRNGLVVIVSLFLSIWKCWVLRFLVKISVIWSLVEMCLIVRLPWRTFSWTKWKSISTCFILKCMVGFLARNVAPKLSCHKIGEHCWTIPISLSKDWFHDSSAIASAIALYFDSILERAMTFCWVAYQDIRLGPR